MSPSGRVFSGLAIMAALTGAMPHPSNDRRSGSVKIFTDNFDNVTVVEAAVQNVGYQNDINYSQFKVGDAGTLNGVAPVSSPNVAAVDILTTEENGGDSMNPSATAVKSADLQYFSLVSFFAGCVDEAAQSDASVATGCNFVVTGYDIHGNMVPEASFGFAPSVATRAPLNLVLLPLQFSLGQLQNFTLGVSAATVDTTATVLTIDNVTHINTYWS